ncbi:MAG: urease accessory protein UreD [Pseudolabrys sp.]
MTVAALRDEAEIFAANRATGHVVVTAGFERGTTVRRDVQESGSLRVRFPNTASDELEAVIVNIAGGMTGGDRFSVSMAAGARSRLLAGTTAAEKIYRSNGADTELSVSLSAGPRSELAWLPQETILFDRARLARRIDVDIAEDASLLMCEAVVFGRGAMGERVAQGRLHDRWRVRRGGKLIFAETVRLDGAISERLAGTAVASGAVAVATLLAVPGDDAIAAQVRDLSEKFTGEVGVSAWNGLALVRFCARDGAALRRDLTTVLTVLRQPGLPRLWLS